MLYRSRRLGVGLFLVRGRDGISLGVSGVFEFFYFIFSFFVGEKFGFLVFRDFFKYIFFIFKS